MSDRKNRDVGKRRVHQREPYDDMFDPREKSIKRVKRAAHIARSQLAEGIEEASQEDRPEEAPCSPSSSPF